MKTSAHYHAKQLAQAIGISASRVRQRLSELGINGTEDLDGKRTFPLQELPRDWRQEISRRARRSGYTNDLDWIGSRAAWQPPIALRELRAHIVRKAEQRRDVLHAILVDDRLSSDLARAAAGLHAWRSKFPGVPLPSIRTLSRWIKQAIKRDDGRCEFDRVELYLIGRLARQKASHNAPLSDSVNETSLLSYSGACALCSELINRGMAKNKARRAVLKKLREADTAGRSAHAICEMFNRAFNKWTEVGELRDYRKGRSGRKPKFELNADESNALRNARLKKGSLPLAIDEFIKAPECRPETCAKILAELDRAARERRLPNWPLSLKRAGHISDDLKAKFRGQKAFQQFELADRRGLWLIDENNRKIAIIGNSLWESDDFSSNEPHSYVDPGTGLVRVGRQNLATMCVFSAAWLGVNPVGRERDAYRMEDIADHLRHVVEAHGLPQAWRFERGIWSNQVIDGIKLGDGTRWGGLDALFKVVHVFKSRSKGLIESSFNFLQSLLAHESLSIGRRRGEFERATKLMIAANNGDERAAKQFWDISTAADAQASAMIRFNDKPKKRYIFGRKLVVPSDLQRTSERRKCPAHELWRFSPIKREATIRRGAIEVSVPHYPLPFRFHCNGVTDLYFEYGYAVLIAFHPGRPEEGCHVFNAERGVLNRDRLKFGELMFVAPMAEDSPQLNLHPSEYEFAARKKANASVRTEFRAIVGAGAKPSTVSVARDGFGSSAERLTGCAKSGRVDRLSRHADARAKRGDEILREAEEKELALIARNERMEKDARDRGDLL